ncbi:HNH endonuclease [Mucilaginibacter myungsuensis]|uniref:HNH endonuclease n=1 Tax=Mucilaginibacter myungsuensis TaxID=649104 RepID=A0A929L029_9SPHI|nr:HNH endonuclease [Mucilaginibacter myungsuensis]MBE9663782.1 HNH endonuclease [Mucilaginibacter myungsuensis]MDN3598503.1 HNH endonuclease [Mucilaginibacter myungsuensis]
MSVSYIPANVRQILWGKAAGRCQYEGCNQALFFDTLTKGEFNSSYIAHIYADSKGGPRYDEALSFKLKCDLSNLMLLCDSHHRLIDKHEIDGHPAPRLQKMKADHEARISMLTDITPDQQSHIVLFGANIGQHQIPLNYREAANAIIPRRYPSQLAALELGLKNSVSEDDQQAYWLIQDEQIKSAFQKIIAPLKGSDKVQHFSLFALAPIPLLMRIGTLFSDIYEVDVFQRHREPSTWLWQDDSPVLDFFIRRPSSFDGVPVLKLSLSANITDNRVTEVIDEECNIWEVTINDPHNDFLKNALTLQAFRKIIRLAFNEIKIRHGQNIKLHVMPALPVSAAVEFGRVWMPKADMPLLIYDQSRVHNRFISTLNFN